MVAKGRPPSVGFQPRSLPAHCPAVYLLIMHATAFTYPTRRRKMLWGRGSRDVVTDLHMENKTVSQFQTMLQTCHKAQNRTHNTTREKQTLNQKIESVKKLHLKKIHCFLVKDVPQFHFNRAASEISLKLYVIFSLKWNQKILQRCSANPFLRKRNGQCYYMGNVILN